MRLNLLLLIELVCNLEHRNMDMIMFSQNVTHNNYYSDYTLYQRHTRAALCSVHGETSPVLLFNWQCPLLVLHSLVVIP